MATLSIDAALKARYDALTATNFPGDALPPMYFGQAAQTTGAGAQQRLPYVVFTEASHQFTILDFERSALHVVGFVLDVYANSLADVDECVLGIRLNGGTVGQGLGFDYGTLTDLASPRSTHQIIPTGEPRRLDQPLDIEGNRVHAARLEYRVTVLESA